MGYDIFDRFALPHGDALFNGRFYQPRIKFITPHDGKYGFTVKRKPLVPIGHFDLIYIKMLNFQFKPQPRNDIAPHVGDAATANFFAGMHRFVHNDNALRPRRIASDEMQRGGCSRRASPDDQYVYLLNVWHRFHILY